MELVELNLELPEIFYEIENLMKKAEKKKEGNGEFVIAGGSICNIYMGQKFKDIDLFVDRYSFDLNQKKIKEIFGSESEVEFEDIPVYRGWAQIDSLYRLRYKGYLIEIIPITIERVYDFDVRFRQFYFYKGKTYASKGALKDIENKEIVIVAPYTPLSTLARLEKFKEQFGFTVNEQSFDYLLWFIGKYRYYYDYIEKFIQVDPRMPDASRGKYLDLFSKYQKEPKYDGDRPVLEFDMKFPFHPDLEKHVLQTMQSDDHIGFGLFYDELVSFEKEKNEMLSLEINPLFYKEKAIEFIDEIEENLPKVKIRAVTNGIPITFNGFPKEERYDHFEEYFKDESLKKISDFCFENNMYNSFPTRLGRIPWLPTTCEIKLEIPKYYNSVIGDVLTKNHLILTVNGDLTYHLRKCDNGKYTISGIGQGEYSAGEAMYLKAIGESLKDNYPDIFDFGNKQLNGLFAYSGTSSNSSHFFPYTDFEGTFLLSKERISKRKISFIGPSFD